MALLSRVGRAIANHPVRTAAITSPIWGTGWAVGSAAHGMLNPKEKDTPWFDAFNEALLGDPQADRTILGRDIGFSDVFPLPRPMPNLPGPDVFSRLNFIQDYASTKTFQDINDMQMMQVGDIEANIYTFRQAMETVDEGYQDYPYPNSQYPYRPRARTPNMNATGDIVFGAYNTRHR